MRFSDASAAFAFTPGLSLTKIAFGPLEARALVGYIAPTAGMVAVPTIRSVLGAVVP